MKFNDVICRDILERLDEMRKLLRKSRTTGTLKGKKFEEMKAIEAVVILLEVMSLSPEVKQFVQKGQVGTGMPPTDGPLDETTISRGPIGANDGMSGAAHEWEKNLDADWGSY